MVEAVTVGIPYTVDTGEKLVNETFGPNNIRRRKTGTHELKQMAVQNGRLLADRLSLEEQGFVFVEHKTKVADFFDPAQLESVYYPEVEQLIKARVWGFARGDLRSHAALGRRGGARRKTHPRAGALRAQRLYGVVRTEPGT